MAFLVRGGLVRGGGHTGGVVDVWQFSVGHKQQREDTEHETLRCVPSVPEVEPSVSPGEQPDVVGTDRTRLQGCIGARASAEQEVSDGRSDMDVEDSADQLVCEQLRVDGGRVACDVVLGNRVGGERDRRQHGGRLGARRRGLAEFEAVQGDERQPGEPEHGQREQRQGQEEEPGECAGMAVHALPNPAYTAVEDGADGAEDSVQCVWSAIQIGETASGVPTRWISDVCGVGAFSLSQEGNRNETRAGAKRA